MKSKIRAQPVNRSGWTGQIAGIVSLLSSIIIAGILGFFVDALRREYMPVPWPILLVMSTSCLNVTALVAVAFIRCCFPSSSLLLLIFHIPIAALWIVTLALLGDELGDHLITSCPSSNTFGHDLSLVCRLFKALFSFTIFSTTCSIYLVVSDVLSWKRMKKNGKYTAMGKNTGVMGTAPPVMAGRKKKGMFAGIFKKKDRGIVEDERSIMMQPMNSGAIEKEKDMLNPGHAQASSPAASPEWGPRERVRVDEHPDRFGGQETRYDPGHRIF